MSRAAVAVLAEVTDLAVEGAGPSREDAVGALRRRLAGSSAKDHVVLDFLDDDLREARGALAAVASWVANVEAALADGDAPQERLLSLASGGGPAERVDDLATLLASLRRRLAQVAARM
jgi:hypothetical protein